MELRMAMGQILDELPNLRLGCMMRWRCRRHVWDART
jgi:hypothetical protein